MTTLEQRIKDGLGEARMVVLVVQVLLGFQFRAVLEGRFDRLSHSAQHLHLDSLGLLLGTFALAVAPATFHRLAERGNDTTRLLHFTATLVPLAVGMSADFYVVATKITDSVTWGLISSCGLLVGMFSLWFGYPLLTRRRS